MNSKQLALQIRDIRYQYKSQWTFAASPGLKGFSLEVAEGESFGFLGHNGAGKTTTIKSILGLIRLSSGAINIFGLDSRKTAARKQVGYLPEQPYFYDHLSVREIIEMYSELVGVSGKTTKVIERLGLSDKQHAPMRSLSKGLVQRVAMAQAIVGEPRLLILDEPFSGLDPLGRKEFIDLIFDLKRSGTTIFMSSHILSDVEHLCDRASILVKGELKAVFDLKSPPPELAGGVFSLELVDVPETHKTALVQNAIEHRFDGDLLRIKFAERAQAEQALAQAVSSKIKVHKFDFERNSLQDVFVKLTKNQ